MSAVRNSLSAVLLFTALSTVAQADFQIFSFPTPTGSTTNSANALFDTAGFGDPTPSIMNRIGEPGVNQTVQFSVTNYNSMGAAIGSETRTAKYYLNQGAPSAYNENSLIEGVDDPSSSTNEFLTLTGGVLTFVDATGGASDGEVLLQISYTTSKFSELGLRGNAGVSFVTGSFLDTTIPTGDENFAFSFEPVTGSSDLKSANFTSSHGNVVPVPEPATWAALGTGALALLRRRRRA